MGQLGVTQNVDDPLGDAGGTLLNQSPRAGGAKNGFVVGEVGGDDRSARCQVHGNLALHRVVFAAGQARVDQHIGPARQRDDLLGQNDQSIAEPPQLRAVALARVGGSTHQHAAGVGQRREDLRQ